ncbi:hypothetical protein NBRC116592_36800 [Colwellia sp. KU-HH00111]|uniref:hypothetical protein n=1 Tax=Colwellia sp. KU-HH00111 TaxID=3127652 RepID=UPI0031032C55
MDVKEKIEKAKEIHSLLFKSPKLNLSLKIDDTINNAPFFKTITINFYKEMTKRHKKLPLFGQMTRGVAICPLNGDYESYIKGIESSGHRNVKKANRIGYTFQRINFNDHLDEIWDIRKSTTVRQGKLSDDFINNKPDKITDPESNSLVHGFPYFGVFDENHVLVAYAGCFLAGDVIELSHFYGHAEHQKNGVVPLLITSIAKVAIEEHPTVKFFMYGGLIGASTSLKRFKKKFNFLPHHVKWSLK